MLQNTLSKVEGIAKDELLQGTSKDKLIKVFESYRNGMWVYPGVIIRKLGINPKLVYELLIDLDKIGVLKLYYELYCSQCHRSMGLVTAFKDIPDTFMCDCCEEELNGIENILIIFKVIRDD